MKYLYLAEKPSAMKAVKAAYEESNKPLGAKPVQGWGAETR